MPEIEKCNILKSLSSKIFYLMTRPILTRKQRIRNHFFDVSNCFLTISLQSWNSPRKNDKKFLLHGVPFLYGELKLNSCRKTRPFCHFSNSFEQKVFLFYDSCLAEIAPRIIRHYSYYKPLLAKFSFEKSPVYQITDFLVSIDFLLYFFTGLLNLFKSVKHFKTLAAN